MARKSRPDTRDWGVVAIEIRMIDSETPDETMSRLAAALARMTEWLVDDLKTFDAKAERRSRARAKKAAKEADTHGRD